MVDMSHMSHHISTRHSGRGSLLSLLCFDITQSYNSTSLRGDNIKRLCRVKPLQCFWSLKQSASRLLWRVNSQILL